jgi:hypothetical protein
LDVYGIRGLGKGPCEDSGSRVSAVGGESSEGLEERFDVMVRNGVVCGVGRPLLCGARLWDGVEGIWC